MKIIRSATFSADTALVLGIWHQLIANSPVNLDYQGYEAEFAAMPGKYAASKGCVLLADRGGSIEGCIASRAVSPEMCEMKRLFVR